MTKRTIEFAMMPNRTTRAWRMPREMCTRRSIAPCSIKSFRCSGVQRNSSQSSHSKHVANSVSLLLPFGESLDNESISPISRWWRKTRNIRWRWSGFWRQDCCSSLYRLYKLATLRREYFPPLLIMSDDFPGMRPLSDCVVDGDTKVSELTFPSDVIYILQPQ